MAAVASLALVTAAVSQPGAYKIEAMTNGDPDHVSVYSLGAAHIVFESREQCQHVLDRITSVREQFEKDEIEAHGQGTTVTWACVTQGQNI